MISLAKVLNSSAHSNIYVMETETTNAKYHSSVNCVTPCKSVTVELSEQSKSVVARVEVRYMNISLEQESEEVLKETQALFAKAFKTASEYTFQKNR